MNTEALNALAGVICRAQEQDRTPMGIAFAVDSAGMHMSPEVAAEFESLRARVAELEQAAPDLCADCGHVEAAHAAGAERPCDASGARVRPCTCAWFIPREGLSTPSVEESADKLTALLAPVQVLREDPHDGPLAHPYRVGRDLPEAGDTPC